MKIIYLQGFIIKYIVLLKLLLMFHLKQLLSDSNDGFCPTTLTCFATELAPSEKEFISQGQNLHQQDKMGFMLSS